ncbi:MAG: sigma-70 family RNA polymerase sigma factor [Prevotella sp.]|nr:sigma-70 family RNA polymerase sigma factor [Prevotella sp.]
MPRRKLTDQEIIQGFRDGDELITRDYFYGYCQIAYNLYDSRYQLSSKPGLDFYSLAHKYYLDLILHNFAQLEDHSERVSLKTWMVKGFLFVIWEALRDYKKEYGWQVDLGVDFERKADKCSDSTNSKDFDMAIEDICINILHNEEPQCTILRMILIEGYKSKEVAELLHISPSAVSQRYRKLRDLIVLPYLKRHLYAA